MLKPKTFCGRATDFEPILDPAHHPASSQGHLGLEGVGRWGGSPQHLPQPQLGCLKPFVRGSNWHLGQSDLTSSHFKSPIISVTSWDSTEGTIGDHTTLMPLHDVILEAVTFQMKLF